jgi:hypothetical protein
MNLFTKLVLFWPNIIIVTVIIAISLTIYIWNVLPIIRPIIVIVWIIGFLRSMATISYSSPNSWFMRSLYKTIMPDLSDINWEITDKSRFDHNQQAIYIWYPHSHFAITPFALVAGDMGHSIWKRPIAQCSAPPFFDIPAIRQISLGFGLVRSDYDNLKGTLKQGTSLLIIPGGAREVPLAEHGKMKLVDGRQGFLKLAQEMGIPLIPIFVFGENEFFNRPTDENNDLFQKIMKSAGGGFQPPSISSIIDWYKQDSHPIKVVIGSAFKTDANDIKSSTEKWKKHVDTVYKKYRPDNYGPVIEWIPKSS